MIRKATRDDLSRVLEIYAIARTFMKERGNPNQWGDTYPPLAVTLNDLEHGFLHVLEEDGKIHAVFALLPNGDPAYAHIDGRWINALPHAAVHRVASSGELRGAGQECLQYAIRKHGNVKIDTHPDNKVMQHVLAKLGFVHCGTVYDDGLALMAFQKTEEA